MPELPCDFVAHVLVAVWNLSVSPGLQRGSYMTHGPGKYVFYEEAVELTDDAMEFL